MNRIEEGYFFRNRNIIDIAISFSAMNRIFTSGSKQKIAEKLEDYLGLLTGVNDKEVFEKFHAGFCDWFVQNIFTAE